MRPKFVLILLGAALALVVGVAVFNSSRTTPHANPNTAITPGGDSTKTTDGSLVPASSGTNVVATTPEQDKESARSQVLEQIKEALLEGADNPAKAEEVRAHLKSDDAEVRKSAVETLMHLNDRGAIPALKEALDRVQDPREKVAIMDAIDYLETPEDPNVLAAMGITNQPATNGPAQPKP
jgi:hypothetical protein